MGREKTAVRSLRSCVRAAGSGGFTSLSLFFFSFPPVRFPFSSLCGLRFSFSPIGFRCVRDVCACACVLLCGSLLFCTSGCRALLFREVRVGGHRSLPLQQPRLQTSKEVCGTCVHGTFGRSIAYIVRSQRYPRKENQMTVFCITQYCSE